MSDYDRAFADIVGVEGGYVVDQGGPTKFGLSKRANPDLDIENLTLEQAKALYAARYWTPAHCDDFLWPLSLFVFDAAVNQGVGAAVKLLQKAANTVQDGVLGQNTLVAIRKADQRELCAMFMAMRALRYVGTRDFDVDGKGWFKRLFVISLDASIGG